MANYIEPYAKENSLLQLSLFYFGKGRPEKTLVKWFSSLGEECELECVCKYGVPGSFDQDCYTATMRIWIKQGMPKGGITLNYSDIARELHLEPKNWVAHIKKSLKKLAQARYEFTRCFINPQSKEYEENVHFSLFDSASLFEYQEGKSKRNSKSYLIFSDEIQRNLEAKYYQLLDMVWYRALPEGLPRRLYEYLAKRRYHNINGKFTISEEALCRWLPVTDKNVTTRRKRLQKMAQKLIDAGYLKAYEFDTKKKHCIYTYAKQEKPEEEVLQNVQEIVPEVIGSGTARQDPDPIEIETAGTTRLDPNPIEEVTPQTKAAYLEALKWLSQIPYFHQKRKDEIAALPMKDVAECYAGIRQAYEEQSKEAKRPGPGWVYNAFKEKWSFPDKSKPDFPETPKGKRSRQAKELYDSWTEEKQKEFWEHMESYSEGCFSREKLQEMKEDGKIWAHWGPTLMDQLG